MVVLTTYLVISISIIYLYSFARGNDAYFEGSYSPREANIMMQYGDARSGSTFQWYVIGTIMRLLSEGTGKNVNCMSSKYFKFPKNLFKIHHPDFEVSSG